MTQSGRNSLHLHSQKTNDMQSEQTKTRLDLNQINNNNTTYLAGIHHCKLPRADSHSSEESFETIAPSIGATSAGSSEADDTMVALHTILYQQQQEDIQCSIPLEATRGETDDTESNVSDVRSLPGDYIHNEEKYAVPSNVSLKSSDSHDSSFHSVLYDHWHTADEFEAEYATDFTEEESTDSFGTLGPKSEIGLDFEHSSEQQKVRSVDAVYSEASQGHRQEGLRKVLTINRSLYPREKVAPRPRRIALPLTDPQSPIPRYIHNKSRQARAAIKKKKEQAKEKYVKYVAYRVRRKAMRKAAKEERKSRIIVIPSNHRLKIMWDVATIALTFVSAYVGHIYIRDRSTYEWDWFVLFTNVWFFVDLLLNFFSEHRTADGTVMKTGREVWGRYLTTWFAIDALSLLPWERMFLRPIIQKQKSRNIVVKWFFRSKAVVKVTVSFDFECRVMVGRMTPIYPHPLYLI